MVKFFVIVSLVLSSFIALLFPTAVGLADPLGLDEIREQNFVDSILGQGNLATYYTNGTFFDANGTVINLDAQIRGAGQVPAEGDQSVITDVGFGFLDYPRIVLNAFLSFLIFLTIPVIIMFNMGYPFNVMFATVYGGIFIFEILAFILGR